MEHAGWTIDAVLYGRFPSDGTPMNGLVLRGHGETVLVDAGAGVVAHWGPCSDERDAALAGVGVAPGDITRIVLSHWDYDHAGGLVAGSWPELLRPAFPGVPVVALDEDLGFWRTSTAGDEDMNCGTGVLAVLETAGLLAPVAAGVAFLPDLRLRSIPGHSPGQAMLEIGTDVVFGADLVHEAVHVRHPEADFEYDHDVALGLAVRNRELPVLAERGVLVLFTHIDGWGRVVRGPDGGLGWEPASA
jgi:glyoxylase-like metal-dependent hydrolase (beta-lactamase superfamily II)